MNDRKWEKKNKIPTTSQSTREEESMHSIIRSTNLNFKVSWPPTSRLFEVPADSLLISFLRFDCDATPTYTHSINQPFSLAFVRAYSLCSSSQRIELESKGPMLNERQVLKMGEEEERENFLKCPIPLLLCRSLFLP